MLDIDLLLELKCRVLLRLPHMHMKTLILSDTGHELRKALHTKLFLPVKNIMLGRLGGSVG